MLAACYLLAGLVAIVAGVWGLLGLWAALIAAGVFLAVLAVLETRGSMSPGPPAVERAGGP